MRVTALRQCAWKVVMRRHLFGQQKLSSVLGELCSSAAHL